MANDARVSLPGPVSTGPIKDQMYRLRGEIVSIGGTVDWIVHRLADVYAGSSQPSTKRRWDELKGHLKERGLTGSLQDELQAVALYFRARELAAHAATIIAQVGESTQVFRLYYDRSSHEVELITLDDLKEESLQARRGYEALQAIGRALDDDEPGVLLGMGSLPKAMLIGRA